MSKKNKTRLYNIWVGMRARCRNPGSKDFVHYGARGIQVADEWHDFEVFKKWALNNGYNDSLSIDRIDVNGNYCPENCRWANNKQQANNRTSSKYITYNNETHTVSEWADIKGIKRKILENRVRKYESGLYSLEDVFNIPVREHNVMLAFNGKTQNITDWAKELNLPYSALNQRIYKGWSVEKALTTPLVVTSKTK